MLVWPTLNKNQPLGILLPHTFLNIWRLSYTPQWEQHKEEVEVHLIFVVKSILSSQISNMYVPIVYKFYRKVSVKCISDEQYEPSFSR